MLRMSRELTETTPKELWGERKHRIERQSEDLETKKTKKILFCFHFDNFLIINNNYLISF